MARRRIVYGVLLAASIVLAAFFPMRLVGLLLAVTLALPPLGFLLSLPAIRGCRVTLAPSAAGVSRGEQAQWHIQITSRLPLSRVELELRFHSSMYGGESRRRVRLSGSSSGWMDLPADTVHCDLLECRAVRLRICDCLGLIAVHKKPALRAVLPVWPQPLQAEELPKLPDGAQTGAALVPRPGGGPGEDYEIRDYRPGDPVRQIHWKLSSKRQDPVVREVLETPKDVPVVTFDHCGSPAEMDAILDRVDGICRRFLEEGQPCEVRWYSPQDETVRSRNVASQRELSACLIAAMEEPVPVSLPQERQTVPAAPGARHIHVSASTEETP